MDVPAVEHRDTRIFYCGQGAPRCDHGEHFDKGMYTTACSYDESAKRLEDSCGKTTTTCADKRRVLLASEDGKKHCVLFLESKP
jgi:hypothetical protein